MIRNYIASQAVTGIKFAALGVALTLAFLGNKKYPLAFFILALGLAYFSFFQHPGPSFIPHLYFTLPKFHVLARADIQSGFLLLALPQIPLSIGNSILATRQTVHDFSPSLRSVSYTHLTLPTIYSV